MRCPTTDLDMRLSAAKVTVGRSRLGQTALGANLRGGTLALSIGEAQMYGGIAKGSFGIARSDAVADVKAQFQFTDVDLQACASELFGISKLSGRGNLNVSLEAKGSSPFGLAQSLDGTADLTGHDGAIPVQRRATAEAAGAPAAVRRRKFPQRQDAFDKLNIALKFSDGVAIADDVRVEGPAARLTLTGTASVPAREYDLKGVASLTSAPAAARLRPAVRGPGTMGRSADLSGSGKPDPPVAGRGAAARCGQGPQDPRRGALGDRAFTGPESAFPRPPVPAAPAAARDADARM